MRFVALLAVLALAPAARASGPGPSPADRKFIHQAGQSGLFEVQMGNLASQKATSDEVQAFARQMVTDHALANDQLKAYAEGRGMTLATTLDRWRQRTYDRLNRLEGVDFDRAYIREMVREHQRDVDEFATQTKTASDADLRTWAENTLPILQHHLRMAKEIDTRMAGGMGGTGEKAPKPRPPSGREF